jgi:DNA-directed RNA polymerase subunit M
MEFCPKCGSMLLPKKSGRRARLICQRCGYRGKLRKPTAYKISEKGKDAKGIAIIEKKGKKKKKTLEREYEIEQPEYDENLYG